MRIRNLLIFAVGLVIGFGAGWVLGYRTGWNESAPDAIYHYRENLDLVAR